MACDSGCCGPPKATPAVARIPTPPLVNSDADSCCNVERDSTVSSTTNYEDECCQSPQPQPNANEGDCCVGATEDAPKKDGSCSSLPANIEPQSLKRPSCCEWKSFPCCDSSCIDRLALRKCTTECKSLSHALQFRH